MEHHDPHAESVTLCLGAEKTGKTTELFNQALRLVEDGNDAESIIVFACSPDAADSLRKRLARASKRLTEVRVTTARAFALEVLDTPRIKAKTGRSARMLTRFEESFLMEDLRVSGIPPKRIGAMVGFLRKGMSGMSDADPDWLATQEERDLFALLESRLDTYGAYLESELAARAFRALRSDAQALASLSVHNVLVDDFHLLSRASQHLSCLIADRFLFVSSNPEGGCETFDSQPNFRGAHELLRTASHATVITLEDVHLSPSRIEALNGLNALIGQADEIASGRERPAVAHAASSKQPIEVAPQFEIIACQTPEDEFAAIGTWAQDLLDSGESPADLAVAVPNRTWARNIATALSRHDIPCSSSYTAETVGGDIRYADLSSAAQFVTLLNLAADPRDTPALRAWCGMGEYLTCRSVFAQIMDACRQENLEMADVLASVAAHDDKARILGYESEQARIRERMELLRNALSDLEGRTGQDLIDALSRWTAASSQTPEAIPPAVSGLIREWAPNDDACSLAAKVHRAMEFPCLPHGNQVAIIPAERACGMDIRHMALAGMINGFTPPHASFDRTKTSPQKAARMISRDALRYRAAASSASCSTTIFHCTAMRGTDAQMLDARIERYFIEKGIRHARVSRSIIADAMAGETITLDR